MKRILGNRVLVEQIMTARESKIMLTKDQQQNPDNFDITRKVIMTGRGVDDGDVQIGDIPVFGKYAIEESLKIISRNDKQIISHIVMHVDNIVGIDVEPEVIKEVSNLTLV